MRKLTASDVLVLIFLVTQGLDGALTYVGMARFGLDIEGNPIIYWIAQCLGPAVALYLAKIAASIFGYTLHAAGANRILAGCALAYIVFAVLPWIAIIFFLPY